MTIQLDTPTSTGTPSVKFPNPGDSVVVGVCNVDDFHQRDFDTEEPLYWDDAKTQPRLGKVLTGLVVSASGAVIDTENGEQPVEPGMLVSFWYEGGRFIAYREAAKAAKGVNVGDVMRQARGEDEAPKRKGFNARKTWEIVIRRPEARDGDLADRCVEQYHALKDRPTLDAPATSVTDIEEPF